MTLDLTPVKTKRPYVKPREIPLDELKTQLATDALSGWTFQTWQDDTGQTEAIEKSFKFKNFPAAIAFMSEMVDFCENLQHHPAWANDHNRLRISLTTGSIGKKVSAYDLELATEINQRFDRVAQIT